MDGVGQPPCKRAKAVNGTDSMLELISKTKGAPTRIICLGAHCDDIEIGCGGALIALQRAGEVIIDWVVFSGDAQRRGETTRAMHLIVRPRARGKLIFGDFRDGRFPADFAATKDFIEKVKSGAKSADVVFTHEREDRHQDHRAVSDLAWNTFRDQIVLEYEIPKWDGGLGQPNIFVPITRIQAHKKVEALLSSHKSSESPFCMR